MKTRSRPRRWTPGRRHACSRQDAFTGRGTAFRRSSTTFVDSAHVRFGFPRRREGRPGGRRTRGSFGTDVSWWTVRRGSHVRVVRRIPIADRVRPRNIVCTGLSVSRRNVWTRTKKNLCRGPSQCKQKKNPVQRNKRDTSG